MDQNQQHNQNYTPGRYVYYYGQYYFQDEQYNLYPVEKEEALLGYNRPNSGLGYNQPMVQAQRPDAPTYNDRGRSSTTHLDSIVERFASLFAFDPSKPDYSLWGHDHNVVQPINNGGQDDHVPSSKSSSSTAVINGDEKEEEEIQIRKPEDEKGEEEIQVREPEEEDDRLTAEFIEKIADPGPDKAS